jgi:centromere protein X
MSSCFLHDLSVYAEAIQRAAAIAETEGDGQIEATHLESILPQLLLDF